jgi:CubicO group peptidase (beta-lactamase class C family)
MRRLVYLLLSTLWIKSSLLAVEEKFDSLLKQFDSYIEKERQAWEVPGLAVGIVKGDEVVFLKGYGQRGLTDTRPVDTKTIFQIGSLTKGFTSALVAISIDKGLLKWEDKVIDHLPSFRMQDPWVSTEFEVMDLLSQRSGLPPYAGDTQSFLGYTADDMIDHLRFLQPASSFRAQYAYQNIFFLVAATLLEQKTQLNYTALLKKELFDPLQMNETTTSVEEYIQAPNRAQWQIRLKDGKIVRLPDDFPYRNWNYVLGAAGGINSNIEDMTHWMLLQANQGQFKGKQLISNENMRRMRRPMIYAAELQDRAMYYALGWVHMAFSPHPIIWHDGGTLGVYNLAAFMPEEKLGIIILSNLRNAPLSLALALQFFDLYFDKPNQDWSQFLLKKSKDEQTIIATPVNPHPPLSLSQYAGTYYNPAFGKTEVKIEEDHLVLILGKNQQSFVLTHWDRDIFTLQWPVAGEDPSRILFLPDESGKIAKMEIEMLVKEGNGTFDKIDQK